MNKKTPMRFGLLLTNTLLVFGCHPKSAGDSSSVPAKTPEAPAAVIPEGPSFPLAQLAVDPFQTLWPSFPKTLARGKVYDPEQVPVELSQADLFEQRLTGTIEYDAIDISYDAFGYERISLMRPVDNMEAAGQELRYIRDLFEQLAGPSGWLGSANLPVPEGGERKFTLAPIESVTPAPEYAIVSAAGTIDFYQRYFGEGVRRYERTGRLEVQPVEGDPASYSFTFFHSIVKPTNVNYRSFTTIRWRTGAAVVNILQGFKRIGAISNNNSFNESNWIKLESDATTFSAVGGWRWSGHYEEDPKDKGDPLTLITNGEIDLFAIAGKPDSDEVVLKFAPLLPSQVTALNYKAPADSFVSGSLGRLERQVVLRTLRDPVTNVDCGTLGSTIRAGFVDANSAPGSVTNLPDDLCQTNKSLSDEDLATIFDQMCLAADRPVIDLGPLLSEKSDGNRYDLCERVYHSATANNPLQLDLHNDQPSIVHWQDSIAQVGKAQPLSDVYAHLMDVLNPVAVDFEILKGPPDFEVPERTETELATDAEPAIGPGK